MMFLPLFVSLAGLAVLLPAQQSFLYVPKEYQHVEGPTLRRVAGFAANVRQQVIISQDHLAPLIGKRLEGMSFRRDRRLNSLFEQAFVALNISVSTSPLPPGSPSHIMADNVGQDVVQVFSGTIELPGSAAQTADISPWDPRFTARIPFSTFFHYRGGDLCIELTPGFGLPVSELSRWPVDAATSLLGGSVETVSASCSSFPGSPTAFGSANSFVDSKELVIGRTVTFKARGTPSGLALFLLGSEQVPALDLAVLGSPGCFLHVQLGALSLATTFTSPIVPSAPEFGGRANAIFQMPANTSLLGSEFYCQWVDLGPPIMTSNTLRVTFAADMPSLGMSIVSAPYLDSTEPQTGRVSIDVGHVMRFDYR